MKSLMALFQVVLADAGTRCGISTIHDSKTIMERVEHEGESFLTITLPTFGKDFEQALDKGRVDHDLFKSFSFSGGLPRFLGGFLDLVFDRRCGRLIDEPSIDSIQAIRQISGLMAKVELPCSPERDRSAFRKYIETERDVRHHDKTFEEGESGENLASRFSDMSRRLWAGYLSSVDNHIYREGTIPRHSGGATADKLYGNSKYDLSTWTERLEPICPSWEFLLPTPEYLLRLDSVTYLHPGAETPVKVITVPKTLKTPRIIAIEPSWMQYVQQGVLELLTKYARTDDNARNFVLSDEQEPNRLAAFRGSLDGSLATLDLSEASDRVSNQHVRAMLRNHKELFLAVDACRSRKADVPGHGVIRLAKFASMGSALCFPFEALVFATVVFMGIEKSLNRRMSQKDFESFYGKVRVYGDDIIVPTDYVQSVTELLETFGFRVNYTKSFWTGRFRESCGKEFYAGEDVSITRVRRTLPSNRQDVQEIESLVSFRNQMYLSGYWNTARFCDTLLERLIPFPIVEPTSSLLGRHSVFRCQADGFDNNLHIPLVKGAKAISRPPINSIDGTGALLKWFLKRGDEPFADREHLVRSGRPQSARIKIGWSPPY